MSKILIIEDDTLLCRVVINWLEKSGIAGEYVSTIREGLMRLKSRNYDLVLSDLKLPDGNGIKVLDWLNENHQTVPFIIMTQHSSIPSAVEAVKKGAIDYLEKPVHDIPLMERIQKALKAAVPKGDEHIIYKRESPAYLEMKHRLSLFAPTDATILIQGESGAGKEHIAQEIHHQSIRRKEPFIAKDCATIQKDLAQSILFGHIQGAFTGATGNVNGVFREAERGTLFLDEVENLPMEAQQMLLRVIEERKYQVLGSHKDVPCDVRLVFATNKDLRKMANEGTFRNDLLARINEFPIMVPALRHSREDIMPLAGEFLKLFAGMYQKEITGFTKEARKMLKDYDWPENVRQLKHTIKRAVVLSTGGEIDADALELEEVAVNDSLLLKNEEEELQRIKKAIEQNSSLERAAKELGITRETLFQKRKKYGLI